MDPLNPSEPGIAGLLLEAVVNMPGGSINIFDSDLRYLFAAGRGLVDAGLDPPQLVDRTLAEVFGQDAEDSVRPFYARAFAGETVIFDFPVGSQIYRITAASLPGRNAVMAVAQEITDHNSDAGAFNGVSASAYAAGLAPAIAGSATASRGQQSAVLWTEGTHRCELWITDDRAELRVYVSDVLRHRESVRPTTRGLRQAAALRAAVRAELARQE
jgi:hypothetical protein